MERDTARACESRSKRQPDGVDVDLLRELGARSTWCTRSPGRAAYVFSRPKRSSACPSSACHDLGERPRGRLACTFGDIALTLARTQILSDGKDRGLWARVRGSPWPPRPDWSRRSGRRAGTPISPWRSVGLERVSCLLRSARVHRLLRLRQGPRGGRAENRRRLLRAALRRGLQPQGRRPWHLRRADLHHDRGRGSERRLIPVACTSSAMMSFLVEGRFGVHSAPAFAACRASSQRQHKEYSMAIGLSLIRLMAGSQWTPVEVHFAHPPPPQVSEHARIFRAPVLFSCPDQCLRHRARVRGAAGPPPPTSGSTRS